jgi:hypothetical protein
MDLSIGHLTCIKKGNCRMALNDVYEVVLRATSITGEAAYNVFHFREEQGGSEIADAINTFLDTLFGGAAAGFGNLLEAGYNLAEVAYTKIDPAPRGDPNTLGIDPAKIGYGNGEAFLTACAVTKWTTGVGGRSNRGRTFWGPLDSSVYADGEITSGAQSTWATAMSNLVAEFGASGAQTDGFSFGVWSRKNASYRVISGYVNRVQARTQRRRALGIGA